MPGARAGVLVARVLRDPPSRLLLPPAAAAAAAAWQRKALLRAYQHVYDRLTLPSPVLRHYVASYDAVEMPTFAAAGGGGGGSAGGGPRAPRGGSSIGHVAGIHTTCVSSSSSAAATAAAPSPLPASPARRYGLVLAALDAALPESRAIAAVEALAKALRRDHYRLLVPVPGTLY